MEVGSSFCGIGYAIPQLCGIVGEVKKLRDENFGKIPIPGGKLWN